MECAYSFGDLYKAVFGNLFTDAEKKAFYALGRAKMNKQVLTWAKKAEWHTRERIGSDGEIYIAFAPHEF